jgi:hypothetical protein
VDARPPLNYRAFLLRCLAGIFAFQALVYLAGVIACVYLVVGVPEVRDCPGLRDDLAKTFELAMSTVLALLGGQWVDRQDKKDEPPGGGET